MSESACNFSPAENTAQNEDAEPNKPFEGGFVDTPQTPPPGTIVVY